MNTTALIEEQFAAGCRCVMNKTMFVAECRWGQEDEEFWTATLFTHFVDGCPFYEEVTFTEIVVLGPTGMFEIREDGERAEVYRPVELS